MGFDGDLMELNEVLMGFNPAKKASTSSNLFSNTTPLRMELNSKTKPP
jgi:hypothetical protein